MRRCRQTGQTIARVNLMGSSLHTGSCMTFIGFYCFVVVVFIVLLFSTVFTIDEKLSFVI